jgi:RND family efflux transporter MFP subunit
MPDTSARHPPDLARATGPALVLIASALVAGCGGSPPPGPAASAPAIELATIEVGSRTAPSELLVDGVVEAVEQATLAAQTSGRVAATPVDVDDRVREGDLLLRLRATEQVAGLGQASAALQAAAARDAQARAQFDRIADMYERKVVARATYDEALATREAAAAGLAAARSAVETAREGVAYTEIRAPFDGIVTARHVQAGEAVAPGMPLLDIAGAGALRVVASVPQSTAAQVRSARTANVYVDGQALRTTAVTMYPAADPQSGTFRARAELPEDTRGLAPGMHAKVGFVTGEAPSTTLPRAAVVERSELRAVYVVTPEGEVVLRQVRLGRAVGERDVEVLAGLAPGERVATDPAQAAVRAGARAAARPHE